MRIISGEFKGRRIQSSGRITARPTTDFAKEGLFNLLNNRIDLEGIHVLDLFAGTGGIGIEFISRACGSLTGIEKNHNHCQYIRKICQELSIQNYNLIQGDVFKYITHCRSQFDVIFADPPYELENLNQIPDLIFLHNLLKPDGLFILEHGSKHDFSSHPQFIFHRNYGNVHFSFFEHHS